MKLLIADMDGTVIDSMEFLKELAIALVAAEGHSEKLMRDVYEETFGIPIWEQFYAFNMKHPFIAPLDAHKLARIYESIHRITAKYFPTTEFGKSLATWRWDLHEEWRLALVTSTHRSIVETMPQLNYVNWQFVGGRTGKGTGKKAQIMQCCDELNIPLQNCVYVGDAPSDKVLAGELRIPYYFPYTNILHEILGVRVPTGSIFDKTPMPTEGMFVDSPSRLMGT